jgi:outer membrane biosynthesis protein TonB
MSANPPSPGYGAASPRFWRNVTLIALAHIALIAGLIRWSLAARSAPDAESLVWLSGAEEVANSNSESSGAPPARISVPSVESEPLESREKEPPSLTQAKSEIELPKPTPFETPIPKATPKAKATPKSTPKPTPGSTPKKIVLPKATKSSAYPKPSPTKSKEEKTDASSEKKQSRKITITKTKSSSDSGSEKTGADRKGSAGGGSNPSEYAWYGNMLHDRFYSAWIQPTTNVPSGAKISTLVKVRIEKDGRVSKFEIIKPSQNVVVNESVAVVAKQVTQVDPPPTGLIHGDHYDVTINFELNTNQETAK